LEEGVRCRLHHRLYGYTQTLQGREGGQCFASIPAPPVESPDDCRVEIAALSGRKDLLVSAAGGIQAALDILLLHDHGAAALQNVSSAVLKLAFQGDVARRSLLFTRDASVNGVPFHQPTFRLASSARMRARQSISTWGVMATPDDTPVVAGDPAVGGRGRSSSRRLSDTGDLRRNVVIDVALSPPSDTSGVYWLSSMHRRRGWFR